MTGIDHRLPPIQAQRSKALAKKSRSTTSWPIFACSRAISPSRAFSRSGPFSSKTLASFSTASRLQAAIWVGCSSYLVASSATVWWPWIASSATLALNSPENRLRVLMVDRPLHRRIHLNRLSQKVGPPPLAPRGSEGEWVYPGNAPCLDAFLFHFRALSEDDAQRDMNSVNFVYWMHDMMEIAMERAYRGQTLRAFQRDLSDVKKKRE